MQQDHMADNIDATQITNTDGLTQELQGEEDLDLKNIHFNFYTMNIRWVTTTGQLLTNI